MQEKNWDIFCRVVDNFGDIGVCWRLARQLSGEFGQKVRLWVDDLASFRKLCPAIDPTMAEQDCKGIAIHHWTTPFAFDNKIADIVIEAFACEIPEAYLATMAQRPRPPVWINLEYLSAEPWIDDCHGLASPHPRLPLRKHFFFPGFVERSGGLLREADLIECHQSWQTDPASNRARFGLPPEREGAAQETLISLFCYDNPALPDLLECWANPTDSHQTIRCLIPEGLALQQATRHIGLPILRAGETMQRNRLILQAVPFSSQEDYDRLLSLCAINFVRGEDSFLRAQWAGHPLVWQIYPQEENVHLAKLNTFLDRYCKDLPTESAQICRNFWQAWNSAAPLPIARIWPAFLDALPELSAHAATWRQSLSRQADLATRLVSFCEKLI